MEIGTKITNLYVESDQGQSGDAIAKVWNAPFDFNVIAEYQRSGDYYAEWDDYYMFKCEVSCDNDDAIIKFRGQNKRCPNPCKMRVLRGNSMNRAVFECRVESAGEYVVDVNGSKTKFKVV